MLTFAKPYFLRNYGEEQFGLRLGLSTVCALVSLHNHIKKCLEKQSVAGVQIVSYDFPKAFDKLRQLVIIKGMTLNGMMAVKCEWMINYQH